MKRIVLGLVVLLVIGLAWGATRSLISIETQKGQPIPPGGVTEPLSPSDLEQRLLEVGLHPTGQLSDLGVDDHLARLQAGSVDAGTLSSYAAAIETLSERSAARGQSLPPTLWDVTTSALVEAGWSVYALAEALASDAGAVHVYLLADAYAAFLETRPDALDGALAVFPLARAYVEALPESARAEHARHAKSTGEATLLIWQALLSGTSRHNPLTHRPLWSHGYVGHFSIPHIHQYAVGQGMSVSEVWGVEGFSPTFVGPRTNANQVEHLGITSLLQGVAHLPTAVLSEIEAFEVMVDGEAPSAAAADRALNQAVRRALLPRVEAVAAEIVDAFRDALK